MSSEGAASSTSRCARSVCLLAWAVSFALVGIGFMPSAAAAQISDAWTRAIGVDVSDEPFSARLQALGSLDVSLEEPQARINAYSFSRNPAALLSDEDSSVVEVPFRYSLSNDSYYDFSHSAAYRDGWVRAFLRNNKQWVLGLEADYGAASASRHDISPWPDQSRFIRDFDISYPSYFQPTTGDNEIGASATQSHIRVTYGRAYGKKLSLGARMAFRFESEGRKVPNPYEIDLSSGSSEFTGGAQYGADLGSTKLTLAGYAGWMAAHVKGVSSGSFNEDQYDWSRPQVSYGGELALKQGAWARGVVDFSHRSNNGEEIAEINWAPQFFLNPLSYEINNPGQGIFKLKWTSVLSGLRRNEIATRWMFDVQNTPAHIGVLYRYYQELEWVTPDDIVFQTMLPLDVRRLGYQANAGISLDLPGGKGLLATEGHFSRLARTDYTGQLPEISMSEQTYHVGAEYRALSWLPLRAGAVVIRRDWDRADGYPPIKGTRFTFGMGYFSGLLRSQVDASFAHEHLNCTPGDPSQELSTGDQVTFLVRHTF